jgi:hypothetical protein
MIAEPLLGELRTVSQAGVETLETLTTALGARAGRMKPGERRQARMVVDRLARRIVTWQEIVRDEPELLRPLKALAEWVRGLPAKPVTGCVRDSASVEWRPTDGVVFGGSRRDDAAQTRSTLRR